MTARSSQAESSSAPGGSLSLNERKMETSAIRRTKVLLGRHESAPTCIEIGWSMTTMRGEQSVDPGTPNPRRNIGGVEQCNNRRSSNCVQSSPSPQVSRCCNTSRQNSPTSVGSASVHVTGSLGAVPPRRAVRATACGFMCRMRVPDDNTMTPETEVGEDCRCAGKLVPYGGIAVRPRTPPYAANPTPAGTNKNGWRQRRKLRAGRHGGQGLHKMGERPY